MMKNNLVHERITKILDYYGEEAQANQCIQELAELIVGINKWDIDNVHEEIADVEIMLEQLKRFEVIDRVKIENIKDYKRDRQLKRIEDAKKSIKRRREENSDAFKEFIKILSDMTKDERIDNVVKKEYLERVNNLVNESKMGE